MAAEEDFMDLRGEDTAWNTDIKAVLLKFKPEEVSVPGVRACSTLFSSSSSVKFHFLTPNYCSNRYIHRNNRYLQGPAMHLLSVRAANLVIPSILESDIDATRTG